MANSAMIPIKPDFNMDEFVNKFTQMYTQKGFNVVPMNFGSGVSLQISKDDSGIKKFVGLALGITANITVNADKTSLIVNYTDAEWTGKIVGLAVGWFLCFIPFIIAICGCVKQSDFPNTVTNDIRMMAAQ